VTAPTVHYERLENGLTLLLRETHLAPVANLQIWARVGSADESPDEAGLAHFHEHMLFKGTERRGVGAVAGEIEGAGGRVNAYTSFDVTVYYATVPIEALDTALDVLADAVRHSIFDATELAREQEVVLEEIRRGEDAPGHVLGDLTFRSAYQVHPYRAPILGTSESVASFDRDKVMGFFRHWYAADNLTVVAAGDFDAPALAARITSAFADAPPAGARRQRALEPEHHALVTRVLRRQFELQRVELTWPSARFRDEDATYLDLLSFLLGECESSRLVRRLREREGLVDRIDSSSYTPFDRGLFSIGLDTDEARSRRAIEAAVEEIERLRREPVTQDELERARANFLATEHFERESVSGLASKLGSFEVIGKGWQSEARYFETLRGATRDDLLRVAQTYLSPEQLTATALIPDRETETLDEAAIEGAVEAGVATSHERIAVAAKPAARSERRPLAPRGAAVDPNAALHAGAKAETHTYTLPGGGTLHVAPRRELPVVAARAAFLGGLLAETAENAGLTHFLSSMWSRGTAKHDAPGFARAVEDLAAEIAGFSGRSSVGLTLEVTSDNLDPALDLFGEVLLAPRFDANELERERRETLAAIDRRKDALAQRSFALFTETEFPTHPYRLPMIGNRDSVERFDVEAVRAHHQRLIQSPNLVMAVAGDVDPDAFADALSARLEGMPAGPFTPPTPTEDPVWNEVREAVWHRDRAQAHLVIGFRGVSVTDPDRDVLDVISQLLAGQGGRLFLDLRDRQSLAYTVNATNIEGVAPGFFAIYIATAPDKVEEARRGIFEHLDRLVQEAPDEDELEHTRRHLIGNFAIDQQRNASRAAHMALDGLYGLGPDAHLDCARRIAAVTREDVLRVARRIVRLDAYTQALVTPE
jgi:zinc protease